MGIPSVGVGVQAFDESAKDAKMKEGVQARTVSVPYNYFGETKDRIFAEMREAVPGIKMALTIPLTEEEMKTGEIQPPDEPEILVGGTLEEVQEYFHHFRMTDGLPIIPPTRDRVSEMLKGTSHAPDEILGLIRPEFLQVSVEKVAINAVMAGCNPEYLPVILAIVEGYIEHDAEMWIVSATSMVNFHLVNGPIRNAIGMNRGVGAQGPGNQANATMGRAATLCNINLGGWWPGKNCLGTQGHPAQYTFCVPENEELSAWEPFHVERGYKSDENVVSTFTEFGGFYGSCEGMRQAMPKSLLSVQRCNQAAILIDPSLSEIILREGYTKRKLKEWLWENTTETFESWWQDPFLPNFLDKRFGEPGYWPKTYQRGNLPPDTIRVGTLVPKQLAKEA